MTAENYREPWLLFEAGAMAKTLIGNPDDTAIDANLPSISNHPRMSISLWNV